MWITSVFGKFNLAFCKLQFFVNYNGSIPFGWKLFGWHDWNLDICITSGFVSKMCWSNTCKPNCFQPKEVKHYNLYFANCIFYFLKLQFVLCTLQLVHCTLQLVHCTLQLVHCTLQLVHYITTCTLYITTCTLYITTCALYISACIL